jgi:propionyl-CoA synthetase
MANAYQKHGIVKGDRIIIYMPMIPEAIFAAFASARLGAIHSIVFGGFAAKELAGRMTDCTPKLIVTTNFGL